MRLTVILWTILFVKTLAASVPDILFDEGNRYYQSGEYSEALEAYNELLEKGYHAEELYYNLGNVYYQLNQIPSAILYYEKALWIGKSHREDIEHNLSLAEQQIVDQVEPLPQPFWESFFATLVNFMHRDYWAYLGLVFLLIVTALSVLLILKKSFIPTGTTKTLVVSFLLLFIATQILGSTQARIAANQQDGIIMSESVYVKSTPENKGKDLFIVHGGLKVSIEDNISNWYEIRLADGRKGWVSKEDIAFIQTKP